MNKIALVVGSSGIAGSNLAKELIAQGWTTYGLSRRGTNQVQGVQPIQANLLDIENLEQALESVAPTHVFLTTWIKGNSEEENIALNSATVRNLLQVLSPKKSVQHVALVTGLKHYLGPFEAYANSGTFPEIPVREEHPRLSYPNFYYAQEDEVYAAAARDGFTWSVHRPHTLIGYTTGNLMNMGLTLAVYAAICKEENLPFIYPGSEAQWNGLSDVTDVRILAKQLIWAAETPAAHNEAFNVANGDVFRWKWLWQQIADWFGIEADGYNGTIRPLEKNMEGKEAIWAKIASQYGLAESDLSKLSSPWHTDLDLGRPIEVNTDMEKSRKLGFREFYSTRSSFFELFEQLKGLKLIP